VNMSKRAAEILNIFRYINTLPDYVQIATTTLDGKTYMNEKRTYQVTQSMIKIDMKVFIPLESVMTIRIIDGAETQSG
jgi:uncharacterized 2Fe-2S/4Fe-4S cluster protein (DUF4445 family)